MDLLLLFYCCSSFYSGGVRYVFKKLFSSIVWVAGSVLEEYCCRRDFFVDLSLLSYSCYKFYSGGVRCVYNILFSTIVWVAGSVLEEYCCRRDLLWICYSCHTAAPVSIPEE